MRPLDLPKRADGARLGSVASQYPGIRPWVIPLRVAYTTYLSRQANGLSALKLTPQAISALKLAYSSKALAAKLNWIEELHSGHNLTHCPLCGGLGARTIEHHLSQTHYPEFAVFSGNLIPSCGVCNSKRGAVNKPGSILTTLHPYFDHGILSNPLIYVMIKQPWLAPAFKLRRIPIADRTIRHRVNHHLVKNVDMAAFKTWTAGRWGDFRAKIVTDHSTVQSLEGALEKMLAIDACSKNHNSWDAALVRGVLRTPSLMSWLLANQLPVPTFTRAHLGI
jgi:hypothetical protein